MTQVLVTGGTGVLGRPTVLLLAAAGHDVRVLSRRDGADTRPSQPAPGPGQSPTWVRGDLRDGTGLEDAVAEVDAVVHCASDPRHPKAVDVAGTERLVELLGRSGSRPHLVYVSIVGVDRIPWSYYRAKQRTEEVVHASGVPFTVQRATQFHPFLAQMLWQLARTRVMALPRGFRFQPVAPVDLAARLVAHVDGGPSGKADDLGGPQVHDVRYLARSWLQAAAMRRTLLSFPVPGRVGAAFRSGANLCPERADGTGTWEQFLAEVKARALPKNPGWSPQR